jgi:hypothetical protein
MARSQSTLTGLVDSDSEDDLRLVRRSLELKGAEKPAEMPVSKKARARGDGKGKITKPAPKSSRRSSGRIAAAIEKTEARQALAERNSNTDHKPARTQTTAMDKSGGKKGTRGRPKAKTADSETIPNSVIDDCVGEHNQEKRRQLGRKVNDDIDMMDIPETQQDRMDVDTDIANHQADSHVLTDSSIAPIQDVRTAKWETDTNDASSRRRLGEVTRKYEALETRYRDMRELGIKEAERNFDKLKKQADDRTIGTTDNENDERAFANFPSFERLDQQPEGRASGADCACA